MGVIGVGGVSADGERDVWAAYAELVLPVLAGYITRQVIEKALYHKLDQVQVKDYMTTDVLTVGPRTDIHEAILLMVERNITGLPVVDNEMLVGVISRRDFKKIRKESQLQAPVKAYMSTRVITIEPGKSPVQAAQVMVRHDIGRLPVVEDGRIIGIITRSDTMMYFYDLLPD